MWQDLVSRDVDISKELPLLLVKKGAKDIYDPLNVKDLLKEWPHPFRALNSFEWLYILYGDLWETRMSIFPSKNWLPKKDLLIFFSSFLYYSFSYLYNVNFVLASLRGLLELCKARLIHSLTFSLFFPLSIHLELTFIIIIIYIYQAGSNRTWHHSI